MQSYGKLLKTIFGCKVQKLPLNTRRICPNRDGTKGTGGCIYCLNSSFSPDAGKEMESIAGQIERGRRFFARKYKNVRYAAYFQSYTPTYGPVEEIMKEVGEAMAEEDVAGAVISTRPDCLPDSLIAGLRGLDKPVMIELGAESSHDRTLTRIRRQHSWAETVDACQRCAVAGLPVGLHLIMGLPGEDEDMMLETIRRVNELPVRSVKIHHLQILRGTELGRAFEEGKPADAMIFTPESYAALCRKLLSELRSDISVERLTAQAPKSLLLSPCWGLKGAEVERMVKGVS